MDTPKTTSNDHQAVDLKRKRCKPNRPLLVQKFSVASKQIGNVAGSTEARNSLSTIDFYVDGKDLDSRTVGPMSPEEPDGRLFNTKGDPVILAPGEQYRYLDERQRKQRDPNGKFEFLESIEQQHGGSLRFEPWYTDLFLEDQLRDAQMAGFIDLNEQLKSAYGSRAIGKTPRCQDYYDQKRGVSQVDVDDNAATK